MSEQHPLAAATEEILHEAALGFLSAGRLGDAIRYAAQVLALAPLEENYHALLIRLYRLSGDDAAAERQFAACTDLWRRELGVPPGPMVRTAWREATVDLGPTDLPAVVLPWSRVRPPSRRAR